MSLRAGGGQKPRETEVAQRTEKQNMQARGRTGGQADRHTDNAVTDNTVDRQSLFVCRLACVAACLVT